MNSASPLLHMRVQCRLPVSTHPFHRRACLARMCSCTLHMVETPIAQKRTYQCRPLYLFGLGALQMASCCSTCSCSFYPLGPDQLVLQQEQLEILIDLHPLPLLPLLIIKLHVHLQIRNEKVLKKKNGL